MAILIPSKNIYDKQNPKIRDNVIERIEVGAVEIIPNNESETPVYNKQENVSKSNLIGNDNINENIAIASQTIGGGGVTAGREAAVAYVLYDNKQNYGVVLYIKKVKENKYIHSLLLGENEQNGPNIKYEIYGQSYQYDTNATWGISWQASGKAIATIDRTKIIYSNEKISSVNLFNIPKELSLVTPDTISLLEKQTAKVELFDTGTVKNVKSFENIEIDGEEYYKLTFSIMCSLRTTLMQGSIYPTQEKPSEIQLSGMATSYSPTQLEITVYGNTIGIDLTDKTVYINGETQKKVHSVDGNELMQTANYYSEDNGATKENAIERAFTDTQTDYAKGKETATIRCSISDYYDYDSGDKIISIDNSTGKMSFKMYDQVIPMVYGADGKDHPMSTYQDGTPKVFQVLGSNIYYDGAVWQELPLQEVDKSEIL